MNRPSYSAALVLGLAAVFWSPLESPAQGVAPATAPSLRRQPSVNDTYLQGYMTMLEADKLRAAKNYTGAYFKYREARDIFDSVHAAEPAWQPEIVDYRRRKIRESMEQARQDEIARRAAGGAPAPSGGIQEEKADPNAPLEIREAIPEEDVPGVPRTPASLLEERNRALQAHIVRLEKRNEEILKSLGSKEEELRRASQERLRSQANEKALMERLSEAEMKLQTAKAAEKRKHADLNKRVDELEGALKIANERLAAANASREEMASELANAIAEIRKLNTEVTGLRKEREHMLALLSGGDGVKGVEKLKIVEENQRLKRELAAAQEKMKTLSSEKEADKKEIASLKEQVQSVQESLAAMQLENEEYRAQIASLAGKLDATRRVLAEASDRGAIPESEAVAENSVLREIILQQLKQQHVRERARQNIMDELQKEGVFAKMKELGVESEALMRSVNEMASPMTLSEAQRDILTSTQVNKLLTTADGKELFILDDSQADLPASDSFPGPSGAEDKAGLSTEMKAYANAAEEHFRAGDFGAAENEFRKILVVEPQNVYALCNLGVAQLRLGKNVEAAETLMRAQAYNFDLEFPHYVRGVALLRQSRLDDAAEELEDALKINDQNAAAWHTLGLISIKRGQREMAKQNFLKAVAIDSSCAEAHYNLAVIYSTSEPPQFETARKHYRAAISAGGARDSDLDKLLGMR
jgi:Tfp pilus assembly protein PilF